jgi:hypothetical protein
MENSKTIIDTATHNLRCHKCLRMITPWKAKIIIGVGNDLEIYHPNCYAVLNPKEENVQDQAQPVHSPQ